MVEMRKLVENIRVQEALADLVAQLQEKSCTVLKEQEERSRKMLEEATLVLQGLSRKVADIERDSVSRVKALIHELGVELADSITRDLQQNLVRKASETASRQVDMELQKALSKWISGIQALESFLDKTSRHEAAFYEQMAAQRGHLTDAIRSEMAQLRTQAREIGVCVPDQSAYSQTTESGEQAKPARQHSGGSTIVKLNDLIDAADKRIDDLRQESPVSKPSSGAQAVDVELDSALEGLQSITRDRDDLDELDEEEAKESPLDEMKALADEMKDSGDGLPVDHGSDVMQEQGDSDDFLNQLIEDEKSAEVGAADDEIGNILESAAGTMPPPKPAQQTTSKPVEPPKPASPAPQSAPKPPAIKDQDKQKGLDDLNALLDELNR